MATIFKKCSKVLYRSILSFYYYHYDSRLFYHAVLSPFSYRSLEGSVIKLTHSIEKRISFGNKGSSHGVSKAYELLKILQKAVSEDKSINIYPYNWAVKTLHNFIDTFTNGDEKEGLINKLNYINSNLKKNNCEGGAITVDREDIFNASQNKFDDFSLNRHSIRSFERPAEIEQIENAVNLAKKCPSSCNIQPIKAYLIQDLSKIKDILSLQRGNRGFEEDIPQIIIITADLQLYLGLRERNQCYVDGGIFALSLTYALHFFKVGSCLLNWASSKKEDKLLRHILNIPKNEVIVLIMAVGIISKQNNIPISTRRETNSIFKII
jgi:nitroreductase